MKTKAEIYEYCHNKANEHRNRFNSVYYEDTMTVNIYSFYENKCSSIRFEAMRRLKDLIAVDIKDCVNDTRFSHHVAQETEDLKDLFNFIAS